MSLIVEKRALALRCPLQRGVEPFGLPGAAPSGPLAGSIGHGGDSSTGVAGRGSARRPAPRSRDRSSRRGRRRPVIADVGAAPGRSDAAPQVPIDDRDLARPVGEHREVDQHERRDRPTADQPDGAVPEQEAHHQRPPNASMASWIRASGRSLLMTTLTVSVAIAGQTTTVWIRSLVFVSSRSPGRPAISGVDSADDLRPRRGRRRSGRRRRPAIRRSGPAPGRPRGRARARHRTSRSRRRSAPRRCPCDASEPRFVAVQLRPESSVCGGSPW